MATMDSSKIDFLRKGYFAGNVNIPGFADAIRDSGAFRIEQIKVKSATEAYTEALQKQDVTFKGWRKNAELRNEVMKEQYRIQRMMVMGWKEDGNGRMSADMIMPRQVPENLGDVRKRWTELSGEANRFSTILDEQRMKIGLWSDSFKSASHNVVNWGKNIQWAGRQMMVGLTIPMVALGAATGVLAYNLDRELVKILKVYDYAGDQIETQQVRLREQSVETARFMAQNFGQAAEDTLGVTAALAATGQTGAGLQASTGIVGRAMFLGDLNQQDAIKTAIALQTVYRREGETTAQMNERLGASFDYLNSLENATNLSMQDMTIAIPKLAGVVNALGGDVQDIGTLMTAATSGGINAAEAANALKTVLFRSVSPGNPARESFLAKTGTDIDTLLAQTQGQAIPTLKALGEAMAGLDPIEKAGFLKDFFGIYQGSKAGIIATNLLDIADATTMVGRANAVANQTPAQWAETRQIEEAARQNSASGQFKSALEGIRISMMELGQTFLPIATMLLRFATGLIDSFNGLGGATKTIVLSLLGLGALFGPLVMITGVMANFIGTIMGGAAAFLNWATRTKTMNAQQQAAALLAKQSSLAFRDEATAAKILATQLDRLAGGLDRLAVKEARRTAIQTVGPVGDRAATLNQNRAGKATVVNDKGNRVFANRAEVAAGREIAQAEAIVMNQMHNAGKQVGTVAQNAEKAAVGFGRMAGGALATAGTVGMLVGGTNQWVAGLSTAAMLFGGLNLAGKGLAIQQAIVTAATAAHQRYLYANYMASNRLLGVTKGIGAGAKGFATSLAMAAGLLGGAAVGLAALAGTVWLIKKRSDQALDNFRSLGESAKIAADAMGVAFTSSGTAGESAAAKAMTRQQAVSKELSKQIDLISEMNRTEAEAEIRRIGLEFYQGTGNSDEANALMEMITNSANIPTLKIRIDFDSEAPDQIISDLENQVNKITSRDYGNGFWEGFSGAKFGDSWFEASTNGISKKAGEIGKRSGKILSKGISDELAAGDVRGAEELARKADKAFRDQRKNLKGADLEDFDIGYRNFLNEVGKTAGIEKAAKESDNLTEVLKEFPNYNGNLTQTTKAASNALKDQGIAADETAQSLGELKDFQQQVIDVQKGTMSTAWGSILDEVARVAEEDQQAGIDRLEAAGESRVARIEAQADAQEARFEARSERMDRTHEQQDRQFEIAWRVRENTVTNTYDARIKAIEATMEKEEKAEDQRQRMFEAERTRIQRLSEMYDRNINFNAALNSGNMDEAARLANDAQATTQQWALDDAAAAGGDAAAALRERREGEIEALNTTKDARLEALRVQEDAAKVALADRQRREKQALDDEKNRFKQSTDAQKRAAEAQTKTAVDAANKRYAAAKRALDQELAYARAMTPRNVAEMQRYLSEIQRRYGVHGINLNLHSKQWSGYVSRAMTSATHAAQTQMRNDAQWRAIGSSIGESVSTEMLGMTFPQFLNWMTTGVAPTASGGASVGGRSGPSNPRQADRADAQANANRAAIVARDRRLVQHGGGPAGKGSGRAGRPMSAGLYSDEVPTILQKGEYVVQRKYAQEAGPILEAINNGSFFHAGGAVSGIGAMFQSAIRNGVATAMAIGAQRKIAEGVMPTGGSLANIIGSMGAQGSAAAPGRYGDSLFGADQLANASTIARVGRSMGASQRDIIIGLMTAMQESGLKNINFGDRDSLGLFQQRPSQGWGTPAQVTNPEYASRKFFEGLLRIGNRNDMSLTGAAQAVQRSAFPNAYAKWENEARAILAGGGAGTAPMTTGQMGLGIFRIGAAAQQVFSGGIPGIGAGPPGEDDFASYLTTRQRQIQPDVLAKVWRGLGMVPGRQIITSGLRPGALIAGSGRPSLHGIGRAADIGALARNRGGTLASEQMGDKIAAVFRSGIIPGVSEVLWKTMQGGDHFNHVHVGFRHGGGLIDSLPGLRAGGSIRYDNTIANLHKGEKVLTAPLSSALERGIQNIDQSRSDQYNLNVTFTGSVNSEIDFERSMNRVLRAKENRMGRNRRIS